MSALRDFVEQNVETFDTVLHTEKLYQKAQEEKEYYAQNRTLHKTLSILAIKCLSELVYFYQEFEYHYTEEFLPENIMELMERIKMTYKKEVYDMLKEDLEVFDQHIATLDTLYKIQIKERLTVDERNAAVTIYSIVNKKTKELAKTFEPYMPMHDVIPAYYHKIIKSLLEGEIG